MAHHTKGQGTGTGTSPGARCVSDRQAVAKRGSPQTRRPRRTRRARRRGDRRFLKDDRAQLLILTGVLLVLGFVTIGSTLVQVQTLDESTKRQQRDNLLDTFDELLTKFNQTLVDGAFLGETNRAQFKDFAHRAETQLRDGATKRGIYLTVALDQQPTETFFQRTSRCYAYQSSDEGLIRSFERTTREETIVGAVYDIYAADGAQTVSAKYYVKLYDCLLSTTYTYVDSIEAHFGTAIRFANATQIDDDPPAMTTKEVYRQYNPTYTYLDVVPGSITSAAPWDQEVDLVVDDEGKQAEYEGSTEQADHIRFGFDPAAIPPHATIATVTARVDSFKSVDVLDDVIYLKATLDGDTSGPYAVTTTLAETSHLIPLTHPAGNASWTQAELAATEFQLYVDSGLLTEPAEFRVDYVNLTTYWYIEMHDLEVDFEFDRIPDLFHEHHVNVTYRMVETNTTGEQFHFQAYDPVLGTWRTMHTIEYTDGAWAGFRDRLVGDEYPATGNQRPLFRVIDTDSRDKIRLNGADVDYIEFAHVRVESIYTG